MIGLFTLIGGLWVGAQAFRLTRWYFFTNRDGNSGRIRHWSDER